LHRCCVFKSGEAAGANYPALLPDFLRTVFHLCFMFILYFSLLATNQ